MAAILTPEQVLATTGATVTPEEIGVAAGIIESVTGLDLSVDPLPYAKRDLRHLRSAVAWQARYMQTNGEAVDREGNLASANTNGVAVSWVGGSADGILAPLARMALRRLSWRRSKTVRMVKGRPVPALTEAPPQTLVSDGDDGSWKPLR